MYYYILLAIIIIIIIGASVSSRLYGRSFLMGKKGCLGLCVERPCRKLDVLKAFDRVSQHRKNDPRLFTAFVHLFQFKHTPVYWHVSHNHIYNMVMHVNIQGYQILCQSRIGSHFSPFLFLHRDWFPLREPPFCLTCWRQNSASPYI